MEPREPYHLWLSTRMKSHHRIRSTKKVQTNNASRFNPQLALIGQLDRALANSGNVSQARQAGTTAGCRTKMLGNCPKQLASTAANSRPEAPWRAVLTRKRGFCFTWKQHTPDSSEFRLSTPRGRVVQNETWDEIVSLPILILHPSHLSLQITTSPQDAFSPASNLFTFIILQWPAGRFQQLLGVSSSISALTPTSNTFRWMRSPQTVFTCKPCLTNRMSSV